MDPVVQAKSVTKRYGRTVALDGVSFEVPGGVVFALLGENGAGKTTLLRLLLGLAEPDEGSARVLGLDSCRQGLEVRRRVGYVPERATLYEWMTVAEIGWFTSGFYGPTFLAEYQRYTSELELDSRKRLRELSKGTRAKVVLALALAQDPELLVLDEPTSGLDTLVRREFLSRMVDRAATGKTVLLSSHQISEVERVADYVAILREGRLMAVERLEDLKADTREVIITLRESRLRPERWPGDVLLEENRGRQCLLLIRGASMEKFEKLKQEGAVQSVEWRHPSLEEIYVGLMARSPASRPAEELESVEEVPSR